MTERREPTISSMPIDSRDDNGRARAQSASSGGSPRGSTPPPPRPVSQRPVIVRSKLAPVALVMVVIVGAFAGFTYSLLMETQRQLDGTLTQLHSAESRVAQLEKRLEMSDDESSQSLTVIQANVKENSSEIRKLWGVSYDRNRKSIATLEEAVTKVQSTVNNLDKKMGDLAGEMSVVSELVEAQQAALTKTGRSVEQQQRELAEFTEKLNALDTELRKKVTNHEEAIRAIDAFRVQVTRDILQLKGG